jgi:8-oxo-dGTP diphosphatase
MNDASGNNARHTGAVEVAAGIVFRDGRVLIAKRRPQDHLGGLWEFPGGKRQAGESYEDCLRRELMEELGIEVEVGERISSITHDYTEKSVHLEFFLCRWGRHEPRALGCSDFAWVQRDQLSQYSFPAADERLLAMLTANASLWQA